MIVAAAGRDPARPGPSVSAGPAVREGKVVMSSSRRPHRSHRSRPIIRRPVFAACFLAAATLAAGLSGTSRTAAQTPADAPALFVERIDVNVINVEVFVTDDQGRHVTGLTKDDFVILQDGQPVEITNFFTVSRQDRVDREISGAAAKGAPAAPAVADLPEDQRLNLLVYVDHFNLHPSNRTRVLDELGGFLEDRMFQGDRVMLVGYDGQLEVVQQFTGDPTLLRGALRKLGTKKTGRVQADAKRRMTQANMRTFVEEGEAIMAHDVLRGYIQEQRVELRRSAAALGTVVRSLAGLPGRKALLYVSDGLPKRPGEELYEWLTIINGSGSIQTSRPGSNVDLAIESINQDESQLFNDITRHANAHQVTLYTVDASGGAGDSTISAAESSTLIEGGGRVAIDSLSTTNMQESLIDMADSTGGRSVLNTFDFADAFQRTAADFDRFYSLGFRSPADGDGAYHKIDVRLKRPGLNIRHRTGYVDKPAVEQVADRTYSSLIFDLEANPLGVEIEFGPPERKGRKVYHLPVLVRIPFREVTLLSNGEFEEGRLRIFLAVKDDAGGISDLVEYTYPLQVPSEMLDQVRGKEIGYSAILKISPGTPRVAIGVWDELSGVESFVHKEVLVERKKG